MNASSSMGPVLGQFVPDEAALSPSLDEALDLFPACRYEEFNRFLSGIPREERFGTLKKMIDLCQERHGPVKGSIILRRIAHHPHFAPFFEKLPTLWNQGVFYANLPFLKTRVCVSLFDHPSVTQGEIDYTCVLFNQRGEEVYKKNATLKRRETHTFEVAGLLKSGDQSFGMLCIQSSEENLHSMRIYAYWYNENSMTTTHEKKALANVSPILVYPSVVCTDRLETYIAVCNGSTDPMNLTCNLLSASGETHPNSVNINFLSMATGLLPLSDYYKDMRGFLKDGPGVLQVATDNRRGMYYYFIHNKELNIWQAQHL